MVPDDLTCLLENINEQHQEDQRTQLTGQGGGCGYI